MYKCSLFSSRQQQQQQQEEDLCRFWHCAPITPEALREASDDRLVCRQR